MIFSFKSLFKKQKNIEVNDLLDVEANMGFNSTKVKKQNKLGTFSGVFTPTLLSIFGVIMFLRLSWVVGESGTLNSVVILVIANIITFFTVFSASTIATNMRVKTGGGYYIISRILGLPVGSSIGISLFLAQAFAVSFYVIGFAESMQNAFPYLAVQEIALYTLLVIFVIALIGVSFVMKSQYIIMVIIVFAIGSFFIGLLSKEYPYSTPLTLYYEVIPKSVRFLPAKYSLQTSFWSVFAVFFPAVTGILGGISLSGDLKDPAKNIPRGAILAVLVSFVIYLLMVFGFSLFPHQSGLKSSNAVLSISKWPIIINLGIWGASLSSAIVSMVTAPRTLQALAFDKIVPKIFGKKSGKKGEPLVALFLTAILAFLGIILGNLNIIAPVLTMFFLITYGMLNFVVVLEIFVKNPSFRPTFKTHWIIPLIGGLGSFSVMFLIDYMATIVALVIVGFLFTYYLKKDPDMKWNNIGSGFWMSLLRIIMDKLSKNKKKSEGKNWRPFILGFASNLESQDELLNFSIYLGTKKGLTSIIYLIEKDFSNVSEYLPVYDNQIEKVATKYKNQLFFQSCVVKDVMEGVLTITQVRGFGNLKYNTVLMGWIKDKNKRTKYGEIIRGMQHLKKNLLILKPNRPEIFNQQIDVWWGGKEQNGKLMLIFAHLLKLNEGWDDYKIVLKSIVGENENMQERKDLLESLKRNIRIDFEIELSRKQNEDVQEMIKISSQKARLVFIGLANPEIGKEKQFINRIDHFLEGLPTTILVKCGINIEWDEM